jgi:3'(2'), 5'-bisphosphate nucleotidase
MEREILGHWMNDDRPWSAQQSAFLLDQVVTIVRSAGALVMDIYATDFEQQAKADASPVTLADEHAEALIVPALRELAPEWPVIAEEAMSREPQAAHCRMEGPFWLVDPLDGTREFIGRNGQFTVNVALIADGLPVLGVVFAPAMGHLYAGAQGHGAWRETQGKRQAIGCRARPQEGWTAVASRSHAGDGVELERFLAGYPVARRTGVGSSLKLCLLASAQADLYPRFGRTMEWDIAAGHAVLLAAGGCVVDLGGAPLRYGKPGFENPHFVAWGSREPAQPAAGPDPGSTP